METVRRENSGTETTADFKKESYRGLCPVCKNSEGCTHPRNFECPVLQCEEFEICLNSPAKISKKNVLAAADSLVKSKTDKDSDEYLGLCKNCDGRKTCTYPKSGGGVWRCEEYI